MKVVLWVLSLWYQNHTAERFLLQFLPPLLSPPYHVWTSSKQVMISVRRYLCGAFCMVSQDWWPYLLSGYHQGTASEEEHQPFDITFASKINFIKWVSSNIFGYDWKRRWLEKEFIQEYRAMHDLSWIMTLSAVMFKNETILNSYPLWTMKTVTKTTTSYCTFIPYTTGNKQVHTEHCSYWWPAAKAQGHQYPQCSLFCVSFIQKSNLPISVSQESIFLEFRKSLPPWYLLCSIAAYLILGILYS